MNELFYRNYSEVISRNNSNFKFELALDNYLANHEDIKNVAFYVCGPPAMMQATLDMLTALGVSEAQIAYDEF